MRTLVGTERTDISASAGHWVFAYLEVTDDTGTLYNLGALSVGASILDFFNTATLSENIDSNTLSFSATMKREIGTASLSPLRTDSAVNESGVTPGTYSPKLDLHREWRIMVAVVPRGTTPALPAGYTELAKGVVDKITIDGLQDTIQVAGRGLEADLLDAFVVTNRTYSGAMETVIQTALNDQMGSGVVSLYTPVSPSFVVNDTIGDINLMPALSDIAALTGWSLRYRYDASDVNRFTLFNPPRTNTTPDWTIDSTEYEDLTGEIDLSNVRNYIKVRFADATAGLTTVVAPGAEIGTVSCTSQTATFATDQSATLANGAIIVVDDVGYVVSAFDGSMTCTLVGAPNFSGKVWYTSASITKYGLRTMVVDLATGSQITDAVAAGKLADAVLSDLQDPLLVQTLKAPGLWFVQLHDYVQTSANGVHYNDDQFGGVTEYSHEFADGMLTTTVHLAGKPKGRYTTWKSLGSGAAANAALDSLTIDVSVAINVAPYATADVTLTPNGVAGESISLFMYDEIDGNVWTLCQGNGDPTQKTVVSGSTVGPTEYWVINFPTTYSQRFNDVDLKAGNRHSLVCYAVSNTYLNRVSETFRVHLPQVPTDTSSLAWTVNSNGTLQADVIALPSGVTAPITSAIGAISSKEVFVDTTEASQWLALSTIPTAETEVGTEYRRQRYLFGAGSVRLNGNFKTVTGTPTVKLKYTNNAFGAVSDLIAWGPSGTGLQTSMWAALPAGALADVGLTLYVADGADTAALDILELDAEFRVTTVANGLLSTSATAAGSSSVSVTLGSQNGLLGSSPWDDGFSTGSNIDTAGTRFAGAKPWTKQNWGTSSDSVSGGQLTITTQGSATLQDPRIITQSLSGAGSTWKFRVGFASLSTNANYNGLGIVARESSSGKLLCYGHVRDSNVEELQVRRLTTSYTGWASNYNLVANSNPFYVAELEIENDGTNLIFRRLESGVWFSRKTSLLTADFTTAPDEIGIWVNGPVSTSAVAVFDYWQRVS